MQKTAYSYRAELDVPYETAVGQAKEALKEEGFGVLTEIDMKAKLKEKLDVDFRRYLVLGACNPSLALTALESELEVGVLLPCNVVVYETSPGRSVVAAMLPRAGLSLVGDNPALADVAARAGEKLERVVNALEAHQETRP